MYDFEYARPASLAEAEQLLAGGAGAKLLAGGQSLLPALKLRLNRVPLLIDLCGISGLNRIERRGDSLVIGAMATHAEVARSDVVKSAIPGLALLAGDIGDPQVRNMGTIGGSLANNDPAADYPAAALALGAALKTSRREIAADSHFTGLFAGLAEDEILTEIIFPIPQRFAYAKFPNPASRFALVGAAVAQTDGWRARRGNRGRRKWRFPGSGTGSGAVLLFPDGGPQTNSNQYVQSHQRHSWRCGIPRPFGRRDDETRGGCLCWMTRSERIFARCAGRILPFLSLLFLLNYLDRVNVGFAALTMNRDLGFSPSVFGFGAGLLFFSFFLFAIPSAVAAERFGARWWLFGTLFAWGLLSAGTAFVRGAAEFYTIRFLLGATEAGFLPGVVYYLTLWFPPSRRARYMAIFLIAGPLSFIVGGPLSGVILTVGQFAGPARLAMVVRAGRPADAVAGFRCAASAAQFAVAGKLAIASRKAPPVGATTA